MGAEVKIFQLALEQIMQEVKELKDENKYMKDRLEILESRPRVVAEQIPIKVEEDVFIDTKEVLSMLGICYNTLQRIIEKGLLRPIRINQRRIRFSKARVMEYLTRK